jgi:hypothetical protein
MMNRRQFMQKGALFAAAGWVLNEEEREDGSKQGLSVMEPAFQALQKAFPQ